MKGKQWYIIKTQTGYEQKVRDNLANSISANNLTDVVTDIIVPLYVEVDVKDGKEIKKEKRIFPGYILINALMNEDVWYVIRNTMGVFGLLGSSGGGAKPVPLTDDEYLEISERIGKEIYKNANVKVGEIIIINKGELKDRDANVKKIDQENYKITAELNNGMTLELYFGEFKRR